MTRAIGALMVAGLPVSLALIALGVFTMTGGIIIGVISMILGFIVIIADS